MEKLLKLIAGVDLTGLVCQNGPVRPGEIVIGPLSDELKRIYALAVEAQNDHDKFEIYVKREEAAHGLVHEKGEQTLDICRASADVVAGFNLKAEQAAEEMEFFDKLFWHILRKEQPDLVEKSAGIREGFVVVIMPEPEHGVLGLSVLGALKVFLSAADPEESEVGVYRHPRRSHQ